MQTLSQGHSAWSVAVVFLVGMFSTAWQSDATAAFLPGEFITYSSQTWSDFPITPGSVPELLLNSFDFVFPNGYVEIGISGFDGYSLVFTSGEAVWDYLPSFGIPGELTQDAANPSSTSSGVFGAWVLALQLNFAFADAGLLVGSAGIPFENLVLHDLDGGSYPQSYNGWTVRDFFREQNLLLGGGTGAHSVDEIALLSYALDFAFEDGIPSQFAQDHLRIVPEPGAGALAMLMVMPAILWRWKVPSDERQLPRPLGLPPVSHPPQCAISKVAA